MFATVSRIRMIINPALSTKIGPKKKTRRKTKNYPSEINPKKTLKKIILEVTIENQNIYS